MRRGGFTLTELLVVVSVMALLMGLLIPVLGKAREHARGAACLSDLHQMGLAAQMYLDDHRGTFWRYYTDVAGGRRWWFGFESGGPGSGTNRPLDVSRGVLGGLLDRPAERLHCPTFNYDDPRLRHKFDKPSASFGYNLALGPSSPLHAPARRSQFTRPAELFIFADGIHYDFQPDRRYNEGHYIQLNRGASFPSGYAHFRHGGHAQYLLLDGHADAQQLAGPSYNDLGGGEAGNLVAADGSTVIYDSR